VWRYYEDVLSHFDKAFSTAGYTVYRERAGPPEAPVTVN
jgi:hypothetical protein